ncbi:transglycosylase SLT domain-containing protein [Vibrio agarivorans]|uniref:Transglycosylase SLT domain-containing protein n=1 Tax=Vibrio agarivorans TaxID=153622 RepID=A0ABT7XXD1_9VIBR|nr:transglycosylase SLT domain-containing protein [Vibrio agarivorans]MDN2480395.1 transglycosylase SLT domain-containing protein [Vibrio agarivorans]
MYSRTCLVLALLLCAPNVSPKITHLSESNNSGKQTKQLNRLPKVTLPNRQSGVLEMRGSQPTAPPLPVSPIITASANNKYQPYERLIKRSAQKWQVSPTLIVAVMHAESFFNPNAVSHASAIGLMQVLVNGGASEVSSAFFNNRPIRAQDLLIPEINIDVGTAYLHLLNERYLKSVRSANARKWLSIAAYNCGLTNLMEYSMNESSLERFTYHINQLSDKEVYHLLTQTLRISETRTYVAKVVGLERKYQAKLNW